MFIIQSVHNQHIKHVQKLLLQRKYRYDCQETVLEGIHLLSAFLDAGLKPKHIFIPESALERHEVQSLLPRLVQQDISYISDLVANKISALNQSNEILTLIAYSQQLQPPIDEDCVVLENIQDPGNLGAILRSCAASNVRHIVLNKFCADVFSPKVLRAAMGAHFLLNIYLDIDLLYFIQNYQGQVLITTLSKDKIKKLYELDLRIHNAWVFGNEGSGVSEQLRGQLPFGVFIPMMGKIESLNVAMAATICLFEQMRQRIVY